MADSNSQNDLIENNNFTIQRIYSQGMAEMSRPQSYPYFTLYYLLKGQLTAFMNGEVTTVSQGEMVFINIGDLHASASSERSGCERIVVNFSREYIQECDAELATSLPLDKPTLFRFTASEQAAIEQILLAMLEECENQPSFYRTTLRLLLCILIVLLHRTNSHMNELDLDKHPMQQKISEISIYINHHYANPLTLVQLAEQFQISPSYLSRIFKKWTGFHFKEYLQVIRIREAQKRLRETKDSEIGRASCRERV